MPAKSKASSADPPVLSFASKDDWEAWLDANHTSVDAIWLKFAKKASGVPSVVYAEALEVALCYGWIDGQVQSVDVTWYMQRFTPRRSRSKWSKINCAKVQTLIEQGRMKPAGQRQIELAKADGRWDAAYDSPRTATVPDDFAAALTKNKKAAAFFATLTGTNRYAILYRIQDAKRPETRKRRIEGFVEMLAAGKKVVP
ncbi:YdeI/OmpD-associated family protein [Humisphaera borealis]|uniref:YdeI/OmpD-associated family protein n=1 Tax=Humisphaera borealis TaxID=2807512 RepID=A0A7M2X459_9BACT|nr:YdeI/OmpD-associated family protein [Humisphaera borealis]QOV92232.1 YdeI/OmpD-associated family protein [Humisphaera borealis]